ncbi:MAG: hypothetical protein JWP35_4463 [Caulobacter sp.]|nr:hypothetical protein [Caulobacter sp.]
MADSHALFALRRKYGQTLGLIAAGGDTKALRRDLRHLAAVIQIFSQEEDTRAIAPIKPKVRYKPGRRIRGGIWILGALDILRAAGRPLTAREIADALYAKHGLTDPKELRSIHACVLGGFKARSGALVVSEGVRPKYWRVAP